MPDLNVSVGLELDTSAYEAGIARAEAILKQLNDQMTASVQHVEQLSNQVASAWDGINAKIQQATERANALMALSRSISFGAVGGTVGGASQTGALEQMMTRAVSGLSVQLDGEVVGRITAPAVNGYIAERAGARRYSTV